jgi:hypothetical protein
MQQGPLGTDFVLCAVGRMAEDILRTAENSEQDAGFANQWIETRTGFCPALTASPRVLMKSQDQCVRRSRAELANRRLIEVEKASLLHENIVTIGRGGPLCQNAGAVPRF